MKSCTDCLHHSVNGDTYPCVVCDENGSRFIKFNKDTGVKYDNEKPQWSLLPFKALTEVVEVLTYGAKKYAPDNWKKVPNAKQRYIDACFRHLTAYVGGEKLDGETGKSHLAHGLCCMLYLLAFEKGEHND
jgi:hypothetical protein